MTMVEVEPQPRIDTLVKLSNGADARRTEYTGTAWFDGKPIVSGLALRRAPNAPRGIRSPNFSASFFIPDSLPYDRAALGTPTLSVSVVLAASGETGAVVDAAATFTDDPSGAPTWLQVHVHGHIGWPAAVGYRVIALTSPDAVR
ncbi:hypothetical protein [Mycobacterium sp. 852002-51961_SCH5331710]|uniref:hypothetical protein n=1 Tax=Mycobacterium sp. 852002-51961_SCH5331710 TaxID=1834105 RepID=UPI000801DDAC|nr:hypothetical protein [Mycobacterium sp. 852002-51961_SCH5331710]OBB44924.1 hypothetical protein A5752_02925 [Mycobacterium sp. 852002-51961_SCH5331710]